MTKRVLCPNCGYANSAHRVTCKVCKVNLETAQRGETDPDSEGEHNPHIPQEEPLPASPSQPHALIVALNSSEVATKLEALETLMHLGRGDVRILHQLERMAVHDPSDQVRTATLKVLDNVVYRKLQFRQTRVSTGVRQGILKEIGKWTADRLISSEAAEVLKRRYQAPVSQLRKAAPAAPAGRHPTLSQLLLSETSIKIALYLGAFFILAAVLILAIIVEALRLPILLLVTAGFLGTAISIKKRLHQASFILFMIFTFLIPIDAWVFQDIINVTGQAVYPYWMVVAAIVGGIMGWEMVAFQSRIFSVLTPMVGTGFMVLLGRWIGDAAHIDLLLVEVATLATLGFVSWIKRWRNQDFSMPAFVFAHIQQLMILGLSGVFMLINVIGGDSITPQWWLIITSTWFLGTWFYATSHLQRPFVFFPYLTGFCLIPVPLFFLGAFSPSTNLVLVIAWGWGLTLGILAEVFERVKFGDLRSYTPSFLSASGVLFTIAAVGGLEERVTIGIAYLLGTAITYGALTILRPRGLVWSGAILALIAAYFAAFFTEPLSQYDFYPGYIFLWPVFVLFSLHLILRRGFQVRGALNFPPALFGVVVGLVGVGVLLVSGVDEPGKAATGFAILSAFLLAFGIFDRKPAIGYGTTIGLAVSLVYALIFYEQDSWVTPFMVLALVYFSAGYLFSRTRIFTEWGGFLRLSGLVLAALVSASAPFQGGPAAVIGTAVAATFFAVEAFRLRNVWLGFPANALFLTAYFILLVDLEVSEPQYYSVGAAMLGFLMHYLLRRSGSLAGATITGLISQLVLFSTTYIQMLETERFLFFFVLFFQSLIVLVYGLVIREISFVITPIVVIVIGILTVIFSVLAGVPTAILVGCTGLVLLLLGITALLYREKLLSVQGLLEKQFGVWGKSKQGDGDGEIETESTSS